MKSFVSAIRDRMARSRSGPLHNLRTTGLQTLLAHHGEARIALFSAGPEALERDLDATGDFGTLLQTGQVTRYFNNSGTLHHPKPDEAGNGLMPLPTRQFDIAVVLPSARLFANPWGQSYLANIWQAVVHEGYILVAVGDKRGGRGQLTRQELEVWLGSAVGALGPFAVFRAGSTPLEPSRSTLTWFRENMMPFLTTDLLARSGEIDVGALPGGPAGAEFLLNDPRHVAAYSTTASATRRAAKRESEGLRDALERAAGRLSYSVGGVSYKSAVVRHIIATCLASNQQQPVHYCDLGGGIGLLAAELLLDERCPVTEAVNVDLNSINIRLAAELARTWARDFDGGFKCWAGSFADYPFTTQPDIVTLIGSLLYLPQDERFAMLRRIWEALKPGGLLIVHENIKDPRFVHDYEVMFTVDEIDSLLEPLGKVRRFASQALVEYDKAAAGERSVFRVVQKPLTSSSNVAAKRVATTNRARGQLFSLLDRLKSTGAGIVPIRNVDTMIEARAPAIFLKHDVHDVDLHSVVAMARDQAAMDIFGTYFFMPFNHPRTRKAYGAEEQREAMREIAAIGHEVGLHLDPYFQIHERQQPLDQILDALRDDFSGLGFDLTVGNTHGNSRHRHVDRDGYGTSFDLFEEVARQRDFPDLAALPEASADLVRANRLRLRDHGFTHWGDTPLWSARWGTVATNYLTDNRFGREGTFEFVVRSETSGAYYLAPHAVPGSRQLAEGGKQLIIGESTDIPSGHVPLAELSMREGSAWPLPLLILIHPEFYS